MLFRSGFSTCSFLSAACLLLACGRSEGQSPNLPPRTEQAQVATPPAPVEPCAAVRFGDAKLEAAVREAVGVPTGDISVQAAEKLTELTARGAGISSLEGIHCLPNLTVLDLNGNALSNVSPVRNLRKLRTLRLGGNQVESVEPIAELTQLEELILAFNRVASAAPLGKLKALRVLHLNENNLDGNIGWVASLTELRELALGGNVSDISPLRGLEHLTVLVLHRNQIRDVGPLSGLTELSVLGMSFNGVRDVSPLLALTKLKELQLMANPLDCATQAPHLATLRSRGTEVHADCK